MMENVKDMIKEKVVDTVMDKLKDKAKDSSQEKVKTGLVMEGGAMKGFFTCGVIDVMMEHGITFDGAIGVSAGACFGCNYKSHQPGRAIRYNKKYVHDKRYASLHSLITTKNFYNVDFCYHTLPLELDIWDAKTFYSDPMEFYVVASDVETGRAVYHRCDGPIERDLDWIRASASVPVVSQVVEIGDRKLLDGGIADPIPVKYFESKGYEKNVVIRTKPRDYVDQPKKAAIALEKLVLRKFPKFIRAQQLRPKVYMDTVDYLDEQEAAGKAFVICPPVPLNIGGKAKDEADVERVYQIGRKEGERVLEELIKFLQ